MCVSIAGGITRAHNMSTSQFARESRRAREPARQRSGQVSERRAHAAVRGALAASAPAASSLESGSGAARFFAADSMALARADITAGSKAASSASMLSLRCLSAAESVGTPRATPPASVAPDGGAAAATPACGFCDGELRTQANNLRSSILRGLCARRRSCILRGLCARCRFRGLKRFLPRTEARVRCEDGGSSRASRALPAAQKRHGGCSNRRRRILLERHD